MKHNPGRIRIHEMECWFYNELDALYFYVMLSKTKVPLMLRFTPGLIRKWARAYPAGRQIRSVKL